MVIFLVKQTLANKKRRENLHLLKGLNLYYTKNIKNLKEQRRKGETMHQRNKECD